MAIKACWLMTWQKHQFGSLGTGSKISAPRSEVGNSTSFIPGDSQPLAQFGSKMILTNRGRLDRQASEPGDQNMGWKAEEGKYLEQKRGKWYSDKDRAKGNEDEVKEREWDRLSLEFWCQDRLSGSKQWTDSFESFQKTMSLNSVLFCNSWASVTHWNLLFF